MRERGGVVAVFAAITAASFHVGSVSTSPKTAATESRVGVSKVAEPEPAEADLLRTFSEFDKKIDFKSPINAKGACAAKLLTRAGETTQFDWVIASVPDPEHSSLKLDFDRELESIQIAAESSGYQFERFWLPWLSDDVSQKEPSYSIDWRVGRDRPLKTSVAPRRDSKRDELPGVLLFRQPKTNGMNRPALAVFLVSETPTSGLQPEQFRNALCYGRSLNPRNRGNDAPLTIIGPGFSGSFASLATLTQDYNGPIFVRTWTSDYQSQKAFKTELKNKVDLKATTAPSIYSINKFVSHVRNCWHESGPVVLLVEEGTGFAAGITDAASPDNACTVDKNEREYMCLQQKRVFTLKFPRNISSLRNATESDTHLPGFGDDTKRSEMPRNGLALSLKADERASSEIPRFSKQQTPVSQESILFAIGSLLKSGTVHYVGILASDPLDVLFLSRYLRSACPNIRLFTLNTDLLFEHGSDSADYEGVLAITSYPLFPLSQPWAGSRDGLHVFPSNSFEAIYNSVNDALHELKNSPTGRGVKNVDYRDYRDPFSGDRGELRSPPLWITVVGRSGYEPVRLLKGPDTDMLLKVPNIKFNAKDRRGAPRLIPQYWPGWGYCFCLILFFCILYCFLIVWAWPEGKRALAMFSVKRSEPNPAPRAFYLSAIGISLSVLVAIWLVVPGELLHQYGRYSHPLKQVELRWHTIVLFCVGAALMFLVWAATAQYREPPQERKTTAVWSRQFANVASSGRLAVNCSLAISGLWLFTFFRSPFASQPNSLLSHLWALLCFGCLALGATAATSLLPLWDVIRTKHTGESKQAAERARFRQLLRMPYLWGALVLNGFAALLISYACFVIFVDSAESVHFLAAYRSLDLTSGVAPLLPTTLLIVTLIALAIVQLRRVNYYEDRYPRVPNLYQDRFCPELRRIVIEIRKRTRTLSPHPAHLAAFAVLAIVVIEVGLRRSQQTFEDAHLENLIVYLSIASGFFIVLVWVRFLLIWSAFREFLQQLERHPLRNIFSLLPRGFVWSPVWQGGGKKRTHVAITRSLECVYALKENENTDPALRAAIESRVQSFETQVTDLLRASASRRRVPRISYRALEKNLSAIAAVAAHHLEKVKWPKGSYELKAELSTKEETKRALQIRRPDYRKEEPETICGELVAFRFLAFINYVLWQLDNLVGYLSFGFLLLVIALNSYEFRSRTIIDWMLMMMFVSMTFGIVTVFAQADRDAILSRITGTEEGKLDRHFFTHLVSYGAMPALVLAATHFPMVGRFFFSWVKPALEAIH